MNTLPIFLTMTTELDTSNDTNLKVEENSKNSKPNQEYEWIDDAFRVEQTRFMWKSVRKDTGKDFLFGLTEEIVTGMSRWHLKCEQDGTLDQYTRVVNNGVVGGKL